MPVSAQLHVRALGTRHENSSSHRWPQDLIADCGLLIAPGFVIDLSTPLVDIEALDYTEEKSWAYLQKVASTVTDHSMLAGGIPTAVVEWISTPDLHGFPPRIEAWEFSLPDHSSGQLQERGHLLKQKRFIERFINLTCESLPDDFVSIDHRYMSTNSCARSRELDRESLGSLVTEYARVYERYKSSTFPHTLFEQLKQIFDQIFKKWKGAAKIQRHEQGDCKISICVRTGLRFSSMAHRGSGFLLRPVVSACHGDSPLGFYSNSHSLEEIDAGIAHLIPLTEAVKQDSNLSTYVTTLNEAVTAQAETSKRIDFVNTALGYLVDTASDVDLGILVQLKGAAYAISNRLPSITNQLLAINPERVRGLLLPSLPSQQIKHLKVVGRGAATSRGACSGALCLSISSAEEHSRQNIPIIFAADSPAPELVRGVLLANGLIFATGGATSHIAVIARSLGKPCVLGVDSLRVDASSNSIHFGSNVFREGEWLTIDGTTGTVYSGKADVLPSINLDRDTEELLAYCDDRARVEVHVNADFAAEAMIGFDLGARGVGLCRIEHLLLRAKGLDALQRVLALGCALLPLSESLYRTKRAVKRHPSSEGARAVLDEIVGQVQADPIYRNYTDSLFILESVLVEELIPLFQAASGKPVVVRLLDPPLSEFLTEDTLLTLVHRDLLSADQMRSISELVLQRDPMMGTRGMRLCNLSPQLMSTQLAAIFNAARKASESADIEIKADVLAPFVIDPLELDELKEIMSGEARSILQDGNKKVTYRLGCMIETPRAAILADELAKVSDFLSIGTNDLTQFVWACSRDSSENDFLRWFPYSQFGQMPFSEFDVRGVGSLIEVAVEKARRVAPNISIGVCGEHSANAKAIRFFHRIGIDYISCSAKSVPIARLIAGQAAIQKY